MTQPPIPRLGAAIKARAKFLRDSLAGAGIPTTLNPGEVNPPGCWVQISDITALTMDEGYSVRFLLHLAVPEASAIEAWDNLSDLLDKALTVVEPDEPMRPGGLVLPHTPTQALPSLVLTVDELVDAYEE